MVKTGLDLVKLKIIARYKNVGTVSSMGHRRNKIKHNKNLNPRISRV